MSKNNIKYVVAKKIPRDCSLSIGKSYEVVHIIYRTESGRWSNDMFKYNPKGSIFYITIKEDDNGKRHSVWNDYFYSTEEIRDNIIDGILK